MYLSEVSDSLIEGNIIASLDGHDSRAIDLPNGGEVIIRGNILQKGPESENHDMIGLALEGASNAQHTTLIQGNIFIFDLVLLPRWQMLVGDFLGFDSAKKGKLLRSKSPGPVVFRDNTVIGARQLFDSAIIEADNQYFRSRADAELPPYPELPKLDAP